MNKFTGAVVGLGVGEAHARTLADNEKTVLKYLHDIDSGKAECLAKELNAEAVDSYEDILVDPELDMVIIASYDDAHFPQIIKALKAGKHVFIEKPLCLTQNELEDIKKVFKENSHIYLGSNLILRSTKLYRWLFKAIRNGEFGNIYSVEGDYLWGRMWKLTDGWRKDIKDYSIILGASIHLIDLMLWFMGEKPELVNTYGNSICTKDSDFEKKDFTVSVFRFRSGIIGNITASGGCVHPHQHIVKVYGSRKSFIYDDQGSRVFDSMDPDYTPDKLNMSALPDTKGDFLIEFVEDIINKKDPRKIAGKEFDLMSVCLAAQESLETGKEVKVKYL
jgi:predicted dehydrogenase